MGRASGASRRLGQARLHQLRRPPARAQTDAAARQHEREPKREQPDEREMRFKWVFKGENKMAYVFQYGSNTSPSRLNSEDRFRGDARSPGSGYNEEEIVLEFE